MNEMEFLSKEELRRKMLTFFGGKSLDLSEQSLHELPAALFELTELEKLDLSTNKLTTIPENLGKLNNLMVLGVSTNQLSIFPTSLTQLKKLRVLTISHNNLTTIPDAIGEMVELEGLGLSHNQLTVLSPAVKQLKKLEWLDISHNNLTTIPDAIGEMVALERLGLSGNQLTVLSPAIKQLKKLRWLDISHNNLTTIPDAIGEMVGLGLSYNQLTVLSPAIKQLKKLRELDIRGNNLTTIPDAIGEMVELERLELSGNQLTVLSPAIKQLKKLRWLFISHNNLTTIPDGIGEMVELERLELNHNQLTVLSPAIKHLKKLKYLDVRGNPFTVEGMRSVMEIKDKMDSLYSDVPDSERAIQRKAQLAYEEALKEGYVKAYRSRIILVGQDRAGKTSLKKSLLGLPFDPKEQSTEGIEVDPSKCKIDVDQAVKNWQLSRESKPGLLECSKDVAKIVADRMCGADISRKKILKEDTIDEGKLKLKDEVGDVFKSKQVEEDEGFTDILQNNGNEHSTECKDENVQAEPDVMIDVFQPPDTEEHVNQRLEYAQGKPTESALLTEEPYVTMDVWDFAGQHLYYASHPIFLSQRALYILVHNLSKPLDAPAEPCMRQGRNDVKLENPNNETNMENLLSWLATVHSVALATSDTDDDAQHKLPYLRPPVFIVGTHADKPVKDIAAIKKQIKERISGMECERHVVRPLFCIDNTKSQRLNLIKKLFQKSRKQKKTNETGQEGKVDGINELQNTILEVLWQEPYMGEKIPVRWFLFEKVIEALVAKQIYNRNLQQLEHYARKDCFMENAKEFDSMISFYHGLGMIIKHRSTVVLKAQWLIDLFKQLITIPPFNKQNALNAKYWQELEGSGILSMEHVDHVFSSFIGQGIIKEDILDMMERFGLIAKFSVSPTDVKYFV